MFYQITPTLDRTSRYCCVRWLDTILSQIFLIPQFFSDYQTNGFPFHVQFIRHHFDCSYSVGSNKFFYPCCVVICPCCLMVIRCPARLQQSFCLQKTFCAAESLFSGHSIISKGVLGFSTFFGGILTEFNPLNAELNPIRHLLALIEARHFVNVSNKRRWRTAA